MRERRPTDQADATRTPTRGTGSGNPKSRDALLALQQAIGNTVVARMITAQRQSLTAVEAPPPPPPPTEVPVEPVAEPPTAGSWNYVRPPTSGRVPTPSPPRSPRGALTDPVGPRGAPIGYSPPAEVRAYQAGVQQQRVAVARQRREYLAQQPWYRPTLDRGSSAAEGFMGPVQYERQASTDFSVTVSWRPFYVIDALLFEAQRLSELPIPINTELVHSS